jgi:gliding-associated putative ABC transporter substrate-binding component GldG
MATTIKNKRKQQQKQAGIRLVLLAAILVCVNMLAARFHYGLDLTKEKLFTLSVPTKTLLRDMDEMAVVTVYLKGSFPASFQRLGEATRERLQSFREYSGGKVVFKYENPLEGKSEDEKVAIFQQLDKKGMTPVNLQSTNTDEGYSQKMIFPYALVQYKGRETTVRLLENHLGMDSKQNLAYAESLLEYKFASAINRLNHPAPYDIAYIMGNGETLGPTTFDLLTTLAKQYHVDTLDLANSMHIPNSYAAIIINKPTVAFDDKDKFKIDQYVMHGGKVLWTVDMLRTPMDSLQTSQQFIAMDYGLNLDDQLFKYGVRINTDLIEDMQCLPIPVMNQGSSNNDMQLRSWIYFPVFISSSNHPIVKNLDAVFGRFVNTIDTIANPEVKKTILLASSKYSRVVNSPARVSLSMLKYQLQPEMFSNPYHPVAVLLEGKFKSVFQNRLHPRFLQVLRDSLKTEFKPEVDSSSAMIVVSDGDFMENDYTQRGPMEMGFWRFTQDRFANKEFVLNCLDYLTDKAGLIEARSKEVRLRALDIARTKNEKIKWRIINIGVPIALVLIFASAYLFFRKRRYEKKMITKEKANG